MCNRAEELCESRGGRPEFPVTNDSPYGLCGCKATFCLNSAHHRTQELCTNRGGRPELPVGKHGTKRLIRDGDDGERRVWRWGKREIIYLSLHCHHQNDFCIKMGSDESYFNVSLIVRDKVTRQCPQTTIFEEKGEPKRYRTEVLPLTSLPPYR